MRMPMRLMRPCGAFVLLFLLGVAAIASAQATAAAAPSAGIDETIPPGANFEKAEFRLWLPPDRAPVQATLVLVPGSNGDGRPMADDPAWQAFAVKHKLAIVAC